MALVLTYFSVLTTFGLFGVEQVIVRTAEIKSGKPVLLDRSLVLTSLAFIPLVAIILSKLFEWAYSIESKLFIVSAMTISSMLVHNILKLTKQYAASIVAGNSWKFAAALAVVIMLAIREPELTANRFISYCAYGLAVFVVGLLLLILHDRQKIQLHRLNENHARLTASFFVSMLLLAATNNIDRLVGERLLGLSALGDYFFAFTIVVFPANIVAGYIGIRLVVRYREHWPDRNFGRTIVLLGCGGLGIAVGMILVAFFTSMIWTELDIYGYSVTLLCTLIVLAAVRVAYVGASAVLAARANAKTLLKANMLVAGGLVIFVLASISLVRSMEGLGFAFLCLWTFRLFVFLAGSVSLRRVR